MAMRYGLFFQKGKSKIIAKHGSNNDIHEENSRTSYPQVPLILV
jgi:hypothetical protein